MFLTEFQVTKMFLVYLILLIISASLVLFRNGWTFKDKLLRLLIVLLLPVLGMLILTFEFFINKFFTRTIRQNL